MNSHMSKLTIMEQLMVLTIMVYCLNVFNKGYFALFFIVPVAVVILLKSRFKIDLQQSVLIIFSIVFSTVLSNYGLRDSNIVFLNLISPIAFYIFANNLSKRNNQNKTLKIMLLIAASLSLFGFLSVVNTRGIELGWRGVVSIWGGNITATGVNTYLSLGLSLLPLILLSKNKKIRLISLVLFSVSLYSMFALGNRTGLLIIALSVVCSFLFTGNLTGKKLSIGTIILLSSFLFYQYLNTTMIGDRLSSGSFFSDPRFQAWRIALTGLADHPFGGKLTVLPLSYAHNMWLDVGHEAGLIPMILLLVFTLLSLKKLIFILKSDSPLDIKIIFICFFVAFFVTFFLEPIMEGWFYYFNIFCFVFGVLSRETSNLSKINTEVSIKFSKQDNKLLLMTVLTWSIAGIIILAWVSL
ncbi:hypothetical protein MHB77_29460 [Paenibacillus sp. FSL K6-3166]|uniref:hypothetical protein n=1 Tax=unclassified Paenibacillus TaxID=185978 RepID=UPI000BA0AE3D|nr:hypothetical protein [Paenibacillus sp. VTT E-133291]OZQ95854.1 hypothetical protein CA598_08475 [Paenibacillus sp. VTT E-133291]